MSKWEAEGAPPDTATEISLENVDCKECFALVAGSQGAGKSTLLRQFLQPGKGAEDTPKPTVALEYMFARRSSGSGLQDIAHVWELGGGTTLADLLNVPITPQRLPSNAYVIVIDLSRPSEALPSLLEWLDLLRQRSEDCLSKLRSKRADTAAEIEAATSSRLPDDHPDKPVLDPLQAPTLIVGHKFDALQDEDLARQRPLASALRFAAHAHGASLVYTSTRDRTTMQRFRALMTSVLFGVAAPVDVQRDLSHPLCIPAGRDSLDDIGVPPGATRDATSRGSALDRCRQWLPVCAEVFPRERDRHAPDDDADDTVVGSAGGKSGSRAGAVRSDVLRDEASQHPEPAIDALRAQKAEQLEQYAREAERRLKEEARSVAGKRKEKNKR